MTIGTSGRFREDSVQMQQVHTMNSEESSKTATAMKTEDEEARKNVQKTNCGTSSYVASSLIHLCEVSIDSYACNKCGIKFPTESMLNKHKMFHNLRSWIRKKRLNAKNRPKSSGRQTKQARSLKIPEKMKYVCMCCSFTCNRKSTITIHMKKKHLDISCIICDLKCNDYSTLAKHMEKHRNSKTKYFKCNVCSFVSKKRGALVSHVVQTHRKTEDKKKRITRRDVKSKEKKCLEEAKDPLNDSCTSSEFDCKDEVISEPEDNKNFDKDPVEHCDLCDFTCTKRSTLYSHKRRHKVDVAEVYFCNECPFKTNKKSSLYSHRKRKHRPPKPLTEDGQPQLFYCAQCDYKNKNKYELRVHVARKHTNDFKFSCEICGKKFKVKGDLTNHIRFSHKEQPVMCDVCGKTCPNSNSLYVHQKFAHYKAQYECHLCKRRMVTQENLNEHLIKQHENRKAVMCEECGKTFSRNSRLKVHMRVHTGDKPYNCTICSKSFARRTAMKQHLLIHTGVRPYVCDICGKAFTQKPGLISHRKSHPGSHPPLPRIFIDHILQDVMNK